MQQDFQLVVTEKKSKPQTTSMIVVPKVLVDQWNDDAKKLFEIMSERYPRLVSAAELAKIMSSDDGRSSISKTLATSCTGSK